MTPQKYLIIAPAWIGDLVMSQALYKFLKTRQPNCTIHVLAAKSMHPLLERMPEVDRFFDLPFGHGQLHLNKRYQLAKNLRTENYTEAIVLPNSFKSALIPFWAKIPVRTGWRGEWRYFLLNNIRILDTKKLPLMVERFVALGLDKDEALPTPLPFPELVTDQKKVSLTLQHLSINLPTKPILALCPGAEYGPAKRWPSIYYAELAKIKANDGWDVWIFGGPKDQKIANEIQLQCGGIAVDFTGKTNLGQAIDLLSLASMVITNDSGLMHIAAALNRKIIAIYGSSSPKFTPPLTSQVNILSQNLPCSPCFQRECPLKHLKCLWNLTPEMVLKNFES